MKIIARVESNQDCDLAGKGPGKDSRGGDPGPDQATDQAARIHSTTRLSIPITLNGMEVVPV